MTDDQAKDSNAHVIIVTGPTASGKSSFALDMAQSTNGVIINADSMQIYKELPVLTAQPSADEQSLAPHRLYSALDASEDSSATIWRDLAHREVLDAQKSGKMPIFVGGTGFYIKALTEGFSPIPDIDDDYRRQAEAALAEIGHEEFHTLLSQRDPVIAEKLHPNDTHRMIRAWEVYEQTGTPLSEWQKKPLNPPPENWTFEFHVIQRDRDDIIDRIDKRFVQMIDEGALKEVEGLTEKIDSGLVKEDALIIKAHGFRPLRQYIKGEWTLDEAAEQTKVETRQYAKRQMTWVRNQIPEDLTTFHNL